MVLRLKHNPYQGVNAHLHSYFQAQGGWEGFHGAYITTLAQIISNNLPEGYLVQPEKSIQIREINPATLTFPALSEPDLEPEAYLTGVVIYEVVPDVTFGRPIIQMEVLSSINKPPRGGLQLVEIDLLHESQSPIVQLPAYYKREARSFPYYIAVTTPQPTLEAGQTHVYGFGADEALPILTIPLSDGQAITIDFGQAYHQTYIGINAFTHIPDYDELPLNFDRYSADDQQRIRAKMTTLQNT